MRYALVLGAAQVAALAAGCNLLAGLDPLRFESSSATGATAAGSGGASQNLTFVDDELDGEFGAGTFIDTEWSGTAVVLAPGSTAASFESRVLDAGAEVSWTSIGWTPGAPYGKALLHRGASETGYPSGSIDMRGNVLLYHFDGALGPVPPSTTFPDYSGAGYDALPSPGGAPSLVAGALGQ